MNENKFTPRAEAALRLSQEAAGDLGHGYVGTEHLLIGLLQEGTGVAGRVLDECGVKVDKVMELYNAVDSMYAYDEKIFDAVKEVASQYFAGDKPLDDTASLIQSKVSLYVNESR